MTKQKEEQEFLQKRGSRTGKTYERLLKEIGIKHYIKGITESEIKNEIESLIPSLESITADTYMSILDKLNYDNLSLPSKFIAREILVKTLAWAIPNKKIILKIAKYSPIIEIGAGSGFWARLLNDNGVDIVCYDIAPPSKLPNTFTNEVQYFPVHEGTCNEIMKHPKRNLFLCWSPYENPMALECAKALKSGQYLIWVGENYEMSCADNAFWDYLEHDFGEETEWDVLRNFEGIHDSFWVRKKK